MLDIKERDLYSRTEKVENKKVELPKEDFPVKHYWEHDSDKGDNQDMVPKPNIVKKNY